MVGRTVPAIARWLRPSRRSVEVLPAIDQQPAQPTGIIMTGGTRVRERFMKWSRGVFRRQPTQRILVRMDDDGGPSELARANR